MRKSAVGRDAPSVPADARRCAIYARTAISTGRDPVHAGLVSQRDVCAAYIRNQLGGSWIASFEDHGFPGIGLARPVLQLLLADIDAGAIDAVVVFGADRLTRSPRELAMLTERFQSAGVS